MRKATETENRELSRRFIGMFVNLLGVLVAMWFTVTVATTAFPRHLQIWVVAPAISLIVGWWLVFLRRKFRCPVCDRPMKISAGYRCGACGTQFER